MAKFIFLDGFLFLLFVSCIVGFFVLVIARPRKKRKGVKKQNGRK